MSTPHLQREPWQQAAQATRSPLPRPASPGALLASFAALTDHLIAAHTQLISSYLRLGSSLARRSHLAPPTATTPHPRPEDDEPASARTHRDPAPVPGTDAVAARAYEIFVQRGGEPGDPADDWRRAEAELRAELTA
jgi:Protein of unknown function (DUF2934)